MLSTAPGLLFLFTAAGAAAGPAVHQDPAGPPSAAREELVRSFADEGVRIEPDEGWCAIPVTVGVPEDLLEYLLVGPAGAGHESLFRTDLRPSILNTAFLALGVETGTNARWFPKEPPPSDEEIAAGVSAYEVVPPEGDGLYLYAGWRSGEEVYWYRVEDLIRNLASGRSMRRHAWVFLGSRMVPDPRRPREAQVFAADIYQNLVNVSFFSEGYTLLTAALPECLEQTIWVANAWIVPAEGEPVTLVFARGRLSGPPPALLGELPRADIARAPEPR